MFRDQAYFIYLLAFLAALPVVFHFLRTKITLGPFFGLAGVYSIMLWQLLQTGWWVKFGTMNFNAGLTLFIPPILLGALLTFAFDGLRTAKAYMAMVTTTCGAAWAFSIFRESLATYVPLPYLIVLSNREHMAIIIALLFAQWFGMVAYITIRKKNYRLSLPLAILLSIILWLTVYSGLNFGIDVGTINLANDFPSFLLSSIPAMVGITIYGAIAATRGMVMPERSLKSLLSIWRTSEPDLSSRGDEMTNRDKVISELRMLNRKLNTNSLLIEHHMEHAAYGIVITDERGKIRRANVPAQKLLKQERLVGLDIRSLLTNVLDKKPQFLDIVTDSDGRRWKVVGEEGMTGWYEIISTPLKDSDSSTATGYYLLIKDVTGMVREEERKLATRRIRDLNQTGRVLSHDFSNLLIGAEAQLKKVRGRMLDQEVVDAVNGISYALSHGREMLKQLGAGSQFGSPRLHTEKIDDLIRQAVDISRGAAEDTNIRVVYEGSHSWCVDADSNQIVRVFTNLIKNAVRASSSGNSVVISVMRRGNGIEITVSDEGRGMTDEEMKKAFDPGYSTKGEGKGGLGLAISYLMVDAHGGHFDLKKNPVGKGLCAVVWLPESRGEMNLGEFSGKRVIVASDRPDSIQKTIANLEESRGCHVAEAHSEDEVLALIAEEGPWDALLIGGELNVETIAAAAGTVDIRKWAF